jgi:carbamoyltransferase
MGLAAYGKPIYYDLVKKMILSQDPFKLDMSYFNLPKIDYSNKKPHMSNIFSKKFYSIFVKKYASSPINYKSQVSKDLASSAQCVLEESIIFNLRKIKDKYNYNNIYFTGGCAFNSLLIGKIIESKIFKNVSVGTNPGDAGGAIGSAFYVLLKKNIHVQSRQEEKFLGPSFSNYEIKKKIIDKILNKEDYIINFFKNFKDLSKISAQLLKTHGLIFWFQDRMEWGPRALGNRSILADPTKKNIKEFINGVIKKRESFRPFGASIIESLADKYFYMERSFSPNMNVVFKCKEETSEQFPGISHFDKTSRVQTVSESDNKKFYRLIRDFYSLTECPMLINTSLNVDSPIDMSPEHAWTSFIKTNVNTIVLGNWLIQKNIK